VLMAINVLLDRDVAEDVAGDEFPAGTSAIHAVASLTPYRHAFVVVRAEAWRAA